MEVLYHSPPWKHTIPEPCSMLSHLSMVVGGVAIAPLSIAIATRRVFHPAATCILLQTAACGFAVSIASTNPLQQHTTAMLGKVDRSRIGPKHSVSPAPTQDTTTGRFPWWSWVLFWPYHVSLRLLLRLKQLKNACVEPLWDCVTQDQHWCVEMLSPPSPPHQ